VPTSGTARHTKAWFVCQLDIKVHALYSTSLSTSAVITCPAACSTFMPDGRGGHLDPRGKLNTTTSETLRCCWRQEGVQMTCQMQEGLSQQHLCAAQSTPGTPQHSKRLQHTPENEHTHASTRALQPVQRCQAYKNLNARQQTCWPALHVAAVADPAATLRGTFCPA